MAATDMTKAGLEPGCKIDVLPCSEVDGSFSESETARIDGMVKVNPWEFIRAEFPWMFLRLGPQGLTTKLHFSHVQRNYDDAQKARQRRFGRLLAHYPGDAGVPEQTDTIERFCLVQHNHVRVTNQQDHDETHAFNWGDTFEDCVRRAGDELLDGWYPEAVFDLDTGDRIELHIGSPVLTKSDDQGAMINVLSDIEDLRHEAAEIEAQPAVSTRDAKRLEVIGEILDAEDGEGVKTFDLLLSMEDGERREIHGITVERSIGSNGERGLRWMIVGDDDMTNVFRKLGEVSSIIDGSIAAQVSASKTWIQHIRRRLIEDDDSIADIDLLVGVYNALTGENITTPLEA